MREFVEQVGSNVITKDKIIGIDGAINFFWVVEQGDSIKLFNESWYTLTNVKEHLYCNRL
jgi:hypothetical protein